MALVDESVPQVNLIASQQLFTKHLTAVDLAKAMYLSNDSAYKLLRRNDWRISEMLKAGEFLKYNFFELFVTKKPNEGNCAEQLKVKEEELNGMKHKMELLEQENKYLKELVEMAKMKLKG